MAETTLKIDLPPKLQFLFRPARYKVTHGGRGGGKSHGYAKTLLLLALQRRLRVLCAREYMNSIQESVHHLLDEQIDLLGFRPYYKVQQSSISSVNGSEFIFGGLKTDPNKIKSAEGIDICWIEEATKVSEDSWKTLIPTIRKPNSEIWVSFNPDDETDPTYRRFVLSPPPDAVVVEINYCDNPWFPEVLRREMEYLRTVDMDAFEHIWMGKCKKHSKAQVLNGKWTVETFEPDARYWDGPYFGIDWGFSGDPTALVKMWLRQNRLYIEREIWELGLDLDDTPAKFAAIEGAAEYISRADCARPETISHMVKHGFPRMIAAPKWKGCEADGIAWFRSLEKIVIHTRCTHSQDEARLWAYKTDRLTGDVLPELTGKHDNIWAAARYGLTPLIRRGFFDGCDLS